MQKRWYAKGNKKRELNMTPKQALDYGWTPTDAPEPPKTEKPQKPDIKPNETKAVETEQETKEAPKKAVKKAVRKTKSKTTTTKHPDIKD